VGERCRIAVSSFELGCLDETREAVGRDDRRSPVHTQRRSELSDGYACLSLEKALEMAITHTALARERIQPRLISNIKQLHKGLPDA
jgi:hypothetical protein